MSLAQEGNRGVDINPQDGRRDFTPSTRMSRLVASIETRTFGGDLGQRSADPVALIDDDSYGSEDIKPTHGSSSDHHVDGSSVGARKM